MLLVSKWLGRFSSGFFGLLWWGMLPGLFCPFGLAAFCLVGGGAVSSLPCFWLGLVACPSVCLFLFPPLQVPARLADTLRGALSLSLLCSLFLFLFFLSVFLSLFLPSGRRILRPGHALFHS